MVAKRMLSPRLLALFFHQSNQPSTFARQTEPYAWNFLRFAGGIVLLSRRRYGYKFQSLTCLASDVQILAHEARLFRHQPFTTPEAVTSRILGGERCNNGFLGGG